MSRARSFLLLRLAVLAALCTLGAAIGFGYLGRLHLALDAFAHLRLHLAAALVVLAPILLVLRLRIEAAFALLLGVAAIFQTVGQTIGPDTGPPPASAGAGEPVYRLLHMNLRFDNPTPEAALSLIGATRPDVVTLAEVSDMWRTRLASLEAAYPYRLICAPPSHVGGVAILSRRPFAQGFEPDCGDRGSFAHARLDLGGREIGIATLHMGWPWPFEQPWQLPRLTPLLEEVSDTAIIVGDLNAVPWSEAARRVASAGGAHILRGIGPTWLDRRLPDAWRGLIGLPIDNVMLKGGVMAAGLRKLENPGSDHLALLLEFSVAAQEEAVEMQVVERR